METYEDYLERYKKRHPGSKAWLTREAWETSQSLRFKAHRAGFKPGPITKGIERRNWRQILRSLR